MWSNLSKDHQNLESLFGRKPSIMRPLSSPLFHIISNSSAEGMESNHSVLTSRKNSLPQLQGIAVCKKPAAVSLLRDCFRCSVLPHQGSGLASKDHSVKAQFKTIVILVHFRSRTLHRLCSNCSLTYITAQLPFLPSYASFPRTFMDKHPVS